MGLDAEGGIRMDFRNNSFSKGVVMHWSRGVSPSFEFSQHSGDVLELG